MLAIIGTLAFNFQVVMPLLVTRTFDSSAGMYTLLFSVVSIGSLPARSRPRAARASASAIS